MAEAQPLVGLLEERAIRLAESATDRENAIRQCGNALLAIGAVDATYVEAKLGRELSISMYVGEGVAIPHATLAGKAAVGRDALAVLRFPEGVDWGGERVVVCVAIAAVGDGHLEIIAELAQILMDPDRAPELREAARPEDVTRLLPPAAGGGGGGEA